MENLSQEPALTCTESDYSSDDDSSVTADASPVKIQKCRSEVDTFVTCAEELREAAKAT